MLDAMAEHVGYEMWMVAQTTRIIESGSFPTTSTNEATKAIGNALIESALVHVRNLDDFFRLPGKRHPDDVLAIHYLPTWRPRAILSKAEHDDIDKLLAHVTTKRTDGPRPWLTKRLRDGFEIARSFLQQLHAEEPERAAAFDGWVQLDG
jgi:hypothetical protein